MGAPARLTPFGVVAGAWKFVVWADEGSDALQHALDWLEYVERDLFIPEDATVELLGHPREAEEIERLWATIPDESARDAALAAGRLMRSLLGLDQRWRGQLFAIRQGWS